MTKEFWIMVNHFLQTVLKQFMDDLDDESIEAVQHYLDHDEYEMAFEGLFIELININAELSTETANKCIVLGKKLYLHEEYMFDKKFWEKLERFLSKYD